MSATKNITRTYQLPKGYSATFTAVLVVGKPVGFECNWQPHMPPAKLLKKRLWPEYVKARHDFMTLLSEELGGTVAVVEV